VYLHTDEAQMQRVVGPGRSSKETCLKSRLRSASLRSGRRAASFCGWRTLEPRVIRNRAHLNPVGGERAHGVQRPAYRPGTLALFGELVDEVPELERGGFFDARIRRAAPGNAGEEQPLGTKNSGGQTRTDDTAGMNRVL
jgi:hypothetical protein